MNLWEGRRQFLEDVQEAARTLKQFGVGVRNQILLLPAHIQQSRQMEVKLLDHRLLATRRILRLQDDQFDLAST
ncbi:hypothetical protein [Streptomyces sp. enrichment culture]|uniref:hypothetical protein n=1 Tax=Streptomyces sp. enrichment culture TaxID=1795815 RepID=UPI003F54A104